jgi:hypothetical protein
MNSMMNNSRNSLSSQRAALEAAIKDDESPQPMHSSPQNMNRGKDQKMGDDDIKPKMEIDDDDDKKIKSEDSDDHKKMGSKWINDNDIKKEKSNDDEQLDMNTNVINREGGWESEFNKDNIKREPKMEPNEGGAFKKIKEEATSPASSSQDNSQALVKPDLKLEPVPQSTDKKKKCSE